LPWKLYEKEKAVKEDYQDKLVEELYRSIGELKVANDFLKKT